VDQRKFYSELGKLLYAIAAVDGRIHAKESATMKRVVSEQLVPQEASTDHFGTDQAYITEFEFDVMAENGESSEEVFDSFAIYLTQHRERLCDEQKELVMRVADVVAHAFHGVHAKELRMLAELRRRLH
jgi:uncharacterized tellurite resistance protein B-like protein